MAELISSYQKMIDRLKKQGKVQSIEPLLNSEAMRQVDQQMEREHRKFLRRDAESRQTASQILLDA